MRESREAGSERLTWSRNSRASVADTDASMDAESGGRATSTSSSSDEAEEERAEMDERSEAGEDLPEDLFQRAAMLLASSYFHSDLPESSVYIRVCDGRG